MTLKEVGVRLVAEGGAAFLNTLQQGEGGVKSFVDTAEKSKGGLSGFASSAISSLEGVGKAALAMGAVGATAFGAFLASSVNVAADYEATLNRFSAVTGSAIDEAGMKLEDFSKLFLKLGADSQYSAQQAADAAVNLAKGGLDPATISAGGLKAALDLAAAGELDLAVAAEITAKQYGVWVDASASAAEKAQFLALTADLLSQAANASTVDVDELALGLANVGGVAKTAGLSFEDTVTTLALIAPGFSSASDAGTSFKTFLSRLIPQTKDAAAVMENLGLVTVDYIALAQDLGAVGDDFTGSMDDAKLAAMKMLEAQIGATIGTKDFTKAWEELVEISKDNAFYDAQGNFVGMEEASRSLYEATKDLSEEERLMAFNTIFGSDAVRAAAIIAEQGADGFNRMGDAMDNAGTAAQQAEKRNTGFKFALEQLKGSFETLQIIIGSAILPILAEFVGSITSGLNVVMEFVQGLLASENPLATMTTLINSIIPGLGDFVNVLISLGQYLFDVISTGETFNQSLTQLPPAIQPVAMLLGEVATFIKNNLEPILISVAAVIGGAVVVALGGMIAAMLPVIAPIAALIAIGAALYEAWTTNFGGIRDVVTSVMAAIWSVIQSILGVVLEFVQQNGAEIQAFFQEAWTQISAIVAGALEIINNTVVPILTAVAEFIAAHKEEIVTILSAAWDAIKVVVTTTLAIVQGIINTVLAVIKGDWSGAWEAIKGILSAIWEAIKTVIKTSLTTIQTVLSIAWEAVSKAVTAVWEGIKKTISDAWESIKKFVKESVDAIPGIIGSIGEALRKAGEGIVNSILGGIQSAWDSLTSWVGEALGDLTDMLPFSPPKDPSSPLHKLVAGGKGIVSQIQEGIDLGKLTIMPALGDIADIIGGRPILPPMPAQQITNGNNYHHQQSTVYEFHANYSTYQSESSLMQDLKIAQMLRPEL